MYPTRATKCGERACGGALGATHTPDDLDRDGTS